MNNNSYYKESYLPEEDYDEEVLEYEDEMLDDYEDELDDDLAYEEYSETNENWNPTYQEDEYDSEMELILEGFRNVLHENFEDLSREELESAYDSIVESLSPAEAFNLGKMFKSVANVGKKIMKNPLVGQIAKKAFPMAGTAVGTIFGGPFGAAVGGKLGNLAGQAFGGGQKTSSRKRAKVKSRIPANIPATSPIAGSNAAAQFMQLTQNPVLQQALGALSMGVNGKQNFKLPGGQSFSLGAATNLLSQLAGKMVKDAEEIQNFNESVSSYLTDNEGNFKTDPFESENRSQVLYETIVNAENENLYTESIKDYPWSKYFPFRTGRRLLVEYETFIRNFDVGRAFVEELSNDRLSIRIHTKEIDVLGYYVPETKAYLTIWYSGSEEGNKARVIINGKRYIDNNVRIESGSYNREIFMSISIMGFKISKITLMRSGNESKIRFKAGRDNHVLILSIL